MALAGWLNSSREVRDALTALDDLAPVLPNIMPDDLTANFDFTALPLFDRTGWTRVRFGDVVENFAETCDPDAVGLDRFIAMEHLEPGSLHVRSWGNVADGTTFTRRCRPGQVLFGKRRAYQRKVAVAEFEAVVSGDIYVFAPKDPNHLLPELLPFLCMSERFFEHAIGTSAGSLSPRTNWSSLATFEFDLPPLDQQRRIADILWALNLSENAINTLEEQIKTAKLSTACDLFCVESPTLGTFDSNKVENLHYQYSQLGEVCKIVTGGTPKTSEAEFWDGSIKWMASGDVHLKEIFDVPGRITEIGLKNSNTRVLPINAVVIALAGQGKTRGTVAILRTELCCNQSVAAFITDESKLLPDILFQFLDIQYQALRRLTGDDNRTGLNLKILRDLKIALPSIEKQKAILDILSSYDNLQHTITMKKKSSEILTSKLLTSLVEGN
jgi:type I restriction enzyme S subunit